MIRLSRHAIELVSSGNVIVPEGHSGGEPYVQARDEPDGITPSTTEGSDSLMFVTSSSQGTGTDPNQGSPVLHNDSRTESSLMWSGGLPHDPSRTAGSETGLATAPPGIHFKCRLCLSDPTPSSNLTATHCGHLFCYE